MSNTIKNKEWSELKDEVTRMLNLAEKSMLEGKHSESLLYLETAFCSLGILKGVQEYRNRIAQEVVYNYIKNVENLPKQKECQKFLDYICKLMENRASEACTDDKK